MDTVMLCATPRSGSTLLCQLLESSGAAGHPASYFNRATLQHYAEEWGVCRPGSGRIDTAFVRAARAAGSTPNGVFGVRVMAETRPQLVEGLAASTCPRPSDIDVLAEHLGRVRFVHLSRTDTVGQAVSWARSEQTHYWHPGEIIEPGAQDPHYDRGLIARLLATIEHHQSDWSAWFAEQGVEPVRVTYEELSADPAGTAARVLDQVGVELPHGRRLIASAAKQADHLNAEWITRYREGAG